MEYILRGPEFLIRRLDHLELLGQVNPELETARIRAAGFVNGHLCVNYWKYVRSAGRINTSISTTYCHVPAKAK